MLDSISNRIAGPVTDITDDTATATPRDAASESAVDLAAGPGGGAVLGWDQASDLDWLGTGFGADGADAEAAAAIAAGAAGTATGTTAGASALDAIRAEATAAAAVPEAAHGAGDGTSDGAGADGFVPMACCCAFCGESTSSAAISPFIGRSGGFALADGSTIDPFGADPGGAGGPGLAEMLPDIDPGALIQFSGDKNVDATIFGSKWSITNLTFSFPTDGAFYGGAGYKDGEAAPGAFQAFNAQQQAMARYALDLVEQYTGLTFTEITETATTHATLRFAQTSDNDVPSAYANFPGVTGYAGDVWFGTTGQPFYTTPAIGNWGLATIMHEIGHALGLKHGHQDYELQDLTNWFGTNYFEGLLPNGSGRDGTRALDAGVNGQSWSLMTYDAAPGFSGSFYGEGFNQPQTYQTFDIAALQFMYGANYGANSGNTTYTFSTTTGEMFVDGAGQGTPSSNRVLRTIWDGNGVDTIDLSNYSTGLNIDLTPGAFSTFGTQLADHNARNGGGAPAAGNFALARLVNGDTRALIENVYGGSGNDTLTGNQAANVLRGNSGVDALYGGDGDDTLNGGLFKDASYGGNGNDTFEITGIDIADDVYGGAGTDTLDLSGYNTFGYTVDLTSGSYDYPPGFGGPFVINSVENVIGSNQDDTITGASGVNTLSGSGGNDVLHPGPAGISAGDAFYGGSGTDVLLFDTYNNDYVVNLGTGTFDTLLGGFASTVGGIENVVSGNGDDRLFGNYAVNILRSNTGTDYLNGGGGNDSLFGGADDDNLAGGSGADLLDGGTGTDRADYGQSAAGVTVRLLNGTGSGGDAEGDTLVSIEDVAGSNANDRIIGEDLVVNRLWGRDGNDFLNGLSGDDGLYGGAGHDVLRGDEGADIIHGGSGRDRADYASSAAGVAVRLWNGVGTGGDAQGDLLVSIEDVAGSNAGDALLGADAVDNRLWGRNGNDFLSGLSGNDGLYGGNGDDVMAGGAGADVIVGGAGTDRADYAHSAAGVTVRLWSGTASGGDAQGDILVGVEDVAGSTSNDALLGADGVDNRLWGRAGNDFLRGLSGDDLLVGSVGNDRLDGGTGNDVMIGGVSGDVFVFGFNYDQDTATDFQNGTDFVDLVGGLTFGDLSLSAIGGGVRAAIAAAPANWIDLMGVTLADINAGDFI